MCHTYFMFYYNPNPSDDDILRLKKARDDFLTAHSSFDLRCAPTSHFMTTHFLDFVDQVRGAYVTLQEGPEHHHKLDMGVAKRTWTNPNGPHMPFSREVQMLRTYELRRILLERGHKPPV